MRLTSILTKIDVKNWTQHRFYLELTLSLVSTSFLFRIDVDISASTSIFQKLMLCFTLKVKLSFHSNFDAQTSLFVAKPLWLSFHPKPLRPNHLLISPLVAVVITIVFILVVPVLVIVASQFCHSSASQFRPNLLEPSPLVDTPIGFRFKDSLRG